MKGKVFYDIDEFVAYLRKNGISEVFYRVHYKQVGHFDFDIFVQCTTYVDSYIVSLLTLYTHISLETIERNEYENAYTALSRQLQVETKKAAEWIKQELVKQGFVAFEGLCTEEPLAI